MMKAVFDIIQLAVVVKLGYTLIKWAIKGAKSRKKSIVSKIMKLISNKIHYKLDNALKKQKDLMYPSSSDNGKVIPFRQTK